MQQLGRTHHLQRRNQQQSLLSSALFAADSLCRLRVLLLGPHSEQGLGHSCAGGCSPGFCRKLRVGSSRMDKLVIVAVSLARKESWPHRLYLGNEQRCMCDGLPALHKQGYCFCHGLYPLTSCCCYRRCYEVACDPAHISDGYGTGLDRTSACYDPSKSVTIMITDSCECSGEHGMMPPA